jgi:hypothetical protein
MAKQKYDPAIHKNLKIATTKGPIADVRGNRRRLEHGVNIETGLPVYVLDRRDILTLEDVWALGAGYDRLPPVSNIRK